MILVTMFHADTNYRRTRTVFDSLSEAQNFCDYYENLDWQVYSVELCDYTLSDMFGLDQAQAS